MPASPETLFAYLDALGLPHQTVEHAATFTVQEGRELKGKIPGAHTKNLFMKDKDGTLILIAAHADSELKLNRLHRQLGTRRLSFGNADLMEEVLGVTPGSVTGFALMNDKARRVRFVMEVALDAYDEISFHPLTNTATTRMKLTDFKRFVEETGHTITMVNFAALAAD